MKSHEIRKRFLEYFAKQGHTIVPSSSLIPEGDSTLIFTNAGMFQFKNVFLGVDKRPYTRATSSQKCVRAGGKHNDLENVGYTARHHTFFEMLGNFSFGDYFKSDAIRYAWTFLTEELKIPKERLYVTVYTDDDEAEEIWVKEQKVSKSRIYRFDDDNFWRMGDTGPCGPCSEIFYDHYPEKGESKSKEDFVKGCDEDRFIEIWNLVFMQFYEEPKGTLTPLPKPSVDTGAGLERITAAMQGTNNNYESDLFLDYIKKLESWTAIDTKKDKEALVSMRVLADHARCITFLISDGVLPSNEGRGYVLRRILRRAIRYGRKISNETLLPRLCDEVIQKMGEAYPELRKQRDLTIHTVKSEEERFLKTLDQGTQVLQNELKQLKSQNKGVLSGETAFKLYDTYGFPFDLTDLMAREQGFSVDFDRFEACMEDAREMARKTWKGATITADAAHLLQVAQVAGATKFDGYTSTASEGKVLKLSDGKSEVTSLNKGQSGFLFVDATCFYAESGGQTGDVGSIEASGMSAKVTNCTKVDKSHVLHVEVEEGSLKLGASIRMIVEASLRRLTAANHSATHLLHAALRKVLGTHVTQAGSLVEPDRLRFDFTHNKALSEEEILRIESMVNKEIALARPVAISTKSFEQAMNDGAMALFGEKYESDVRTIKMGDFSYELCGGTHVENTSQIRLFKIVSEGGVSAGVRRIEALTSDGAFNYLLKHTRENLNLRRELGIKENWSQYMEKADAADESVQAVEKIRGALKQAEKELKQIQLEKVPYEDLVARAKEISGTKVLTYHIDIDDRKLLTEVAERLRDHLQSGIVVLSGKSETNYPLLVCVTKTLAKQYNAGNLLKGLTAKLGGKGGGRPDFAQGAVDSLEGIQDIVSSIL